MDMLVLQNISKTFDKNAILQNISFSLQKGEIISLLGSSGCGKSTLLRIIAGLEQADCGEIYYQNTLINSIPVYQRNFGFMFQDFALFPHRTVAANIAFGLRMQKQKKTKITGRVQEVLELVGLNGYDKRRIYELSGGEKQRVALARSLAPKPKLLMLDEPLSSLDRLLREQLTVQLREILKGLDISALYVTHDQQEAFTIADRIALMNKGVIAQLDTPKDLYQNPYNAFVARFLGFENLIEGKVTQFVSQTLFVSTPLGELQLPTTKKIADNDNILLIIRPESAQKVNGKNVVEGKVSKKVFKGSYQHIVLTHKSGIKLHLNLPLEIPLEENIKISLKPETLSIHSL